MSDALTIRNLSKHYEKFSLEDVSFSVRQGEIMGFIGRNGAGKTTTLKCLLNFVHPDSGDVAFFGERFSDAELNIKSRIGFVSGGVDYYPRKKLKAITDVTRRFYPNWDGEAYRRYMERFALDESKSPIQLSAGMKVKYNLALALSHHAELLILDEPTSGLDPVSRDELLDIFLSLESEGTSILFSTHITSDLDKCADRITYIHNGHIVVSEGLEDYVRSYAAVELEESQLTADVKPLLIGAKPSKHGYTAILPIRDADKVPGAKPADLETIMIHMEKENG